jgi:hypothetical protein
MQELEQAACDVDVYENHIDIIQLIHKECSSPINWIRIALSNQPEEPKITRDNE